MKQNKPLCYQIELLYNKYSPFGVSVILFFYHVLRFLFPIDLVWIQYLCMPSVCTITHMYNTRKAFKLCKTHRCFVNYTLGNLVACIAEHYWITPYMNTAWFIFVLSGTTLALILGIYYYSIEHEKSNNYIIAQSH